MTVRERDRRETVDEIDRRILYLLQEDARRSYGSIGRQVFLSTSAVKRRVDGLRGSEALLGFTALVDEDGERTCADALIFLTLRPAIERETLVHALGTRPEVLRAWTISGDADAVVEVRAPNSQALDGFIMWLKREGMVWRVRSERVMPSSDMRFGESGEEAE